MGSSIVSNSGPLDLTMPTYGPTITSTLEHTMPAISESVMGERLLSAQLRTFMMTMMMMTKTMMSVLAAQLGTFRIFIIAIVKMFHISIC